MYLVNLLKKFKLTKTSGLQAFQLIRYGSLVVISIVLAKSSLNQEEIGFYESTLFLASMLSFFWVSGLIQAMLPIIGSIESKKSDNFFNAFLVILIFSALTFAAGLGFKPLIQRMQGIDELPYYIHAIAFAAISGPGYLVEYFFLLKNKPRLIVGYGISIFSLQLIAVTLALVAGFGIIWVIWALIGIATLKFIIIVWLVVKETKLRVNIDFIKQHLALGIPLVGKILVSGSASYVDGIIVSSRYSSAAFAVYRYGARELPLVTLLGSALSNSTLPEFNNQVNFNSTLQSLRTRSQKLMHLLFPITIVLIFISRPLFPIVFNPNFAESANIFIVYLLTIISHLLFPQTIAIGLKKTRALFNISVFELALNVSLSLILIQYYGMVGVAIATVIAYWVEKVSIIVYLYTKMGIRPNSYIPLKTYTIYIVLTLFAILINYSII